MKLFLPLAIGIASLTGAKAATVTLAPGFVPANAINISFWGAPTSFTVAVGSWDGANFVQFGQSITDTGTVNGSFTATGPTQVNNEVIHVWIGLGPVSTTSEDIFVLLRTATNTAFPADVSNPLASSTVALHNGTPGNVVIVTGSNVTMAGNTVSFVPEPSSALLGLLSAVCILRRRR